MTPLHYAAEKDHVEVSKALLENGAAMDISNKVRTRQAKSRRRPPLIRHANSSHAPVASCLNAKCA